jgi:hypothetical protein
MYIPRNPLRTEADDFKVRIAPRLDETKEAIPVREEGFIVGWNIVGKYE